VDSAATGVAEAFGLGRVLGGWEPVTGGASHLLWRLRTESGSYAVKRLNRSREAWWTADHLVATAVEQAAYAAGISMPRPVPPVRPTVGLLADIEVAGEQVSFLVHEWCEPLGAVPVPLEWVGRTLAALHGLGLDPGVALVREPHPVDEWISWLDGSDLAEAVRAYLPDIALAVDLVLAVGEVGRPVLTHRDLKPDNVLCTAAGPVLVDWDGAGRDTAEWEAARVALAFARTGAGWDEGRFRRLLAAYGQPMPTDGSAFAGYFREALGGAAWMLWRALGHRPVTPPERAAAAAHALSILAELRLSLRALDTWTAWLGG
jgi:Ser/Thr protein kinase RdoA (MazF antagonist)